MTFEQFKELNPCPQGLQYTLKFNSVREAWDECKNVNNLLWLAFKATKRVDLFVVFAEECAGRALTYAANATAYAAYAAAATADAAAADADAAAAAAYAANAAAWAADAAAYAANAAYTAYTVTYEREIQVERIKELFTDLIFPKEII